MRPMSASEALKKSTPSFISKNRYDVIRTRKDSGTENVFSQISRERTNSMKRKASAEIVKDSGKRPNQGALATVDTEKLVLMDRKMLMLKGICGKLNEESAKLKVDIGLENVLRCLCEFVDVGCSVMENLIGFCKVEIKEPEPVGGDGSGSGSDPEPDPDPGRDDDSQGSYSQVAAKKKKPAKPKSVPKAVAAVPPRDPKLQAFQDAVKHSERSTLVFNLDLGRNKTLNEKTILTKATLALSEAAAAAEGNKGKPPSKEAVAALDDIMSVTEDVTLFGRVTKPYVNPRNSADPRNKTFFTLPVRYEFRDKDTKIEAETILRDTCKVECTTPYPTILRECIKQVVTHMRDTFPNDFVKVTVDSANMALKVTRKVKGRGWFSLDDPIKLPVEVLDIHAKSVPEGFRLNNLPNLKKASVSSVPDDHDITDK
jgi:hypothetical protein